jgi:putative flavoprotein involved in K+ transport
MMGPELDNGSAAVPGAPHERFDTVIIGGGQAGLSVGYHLARLNQPFVIVDEHERIGDNWRERYDSLRLFSPAKFSALPGMAFPAPRWVFPSGHEVGDYLESYAARMQPSLIAETRVDGLWAVNGGGFLITAGQRRLAAARVVVATGAYRVPCVPGFARQLDPRIRQMHSSEYRDPSQLLTGSALVVGAGHSGADIALEVAAAHTTWLSGAVHGQIPLDIDSWPARPVFWLLWFAVNHVLTVRIPLVRDVARSRTIHGVKPLVRAKLPQLAAAGVRHVSKRTTGVRDGLPVLADGRVLTVANVIWCTGFRHDFSWIHPPVTDEDGWPRHERGVATSMPGLYFAGLPFQYSVASNLLGGVGRDAHYIAEHIATRQPALEPRVTRST